jgi:hypothetical protein
MNPKKLLGQENNTITLDRMVWAWRCEIAALYAQAPNAVAVLAKSPAAEN